MKHPVFDPIVRIGVRPDEPETGFGPRKPGSRRPHSDARVAAVRRLIEESTLTYGEIAARTGVGRASICRWTQHQGWKRPPFAPRATDTVPTARASARLRQRTLAARLTALAERHLRELEAASCVDADKLAEALELVRMAKLAGMGRNRPRKGEGAVVRPPRGPLHPRRELGYADVDFHRAPRAALEDFLEHRARPAEAEKPPRRSRARRLSRVEEYLWMRERR